MVDLKGKELMDSNSERPIFILSAGWRSGSTLLQRVLCSHPDVMIWGENTALLHDLAAAHKKMEALQDLSEAQKQQSGDKVHQGWIPMLNPGVEDFERGLRRLLESTYRDPARRGGKARWGFKEVRHDMSSARFLHRLYPEARFLLLVRNPIDCLASARATQKGDRGLLAQAGGARAYVEHWPRLAGSYLDEGETAPGLLVRYESMIDDPDTWVRRIAEFLELEYGDFDRGVFKKKLRGWKREPYLAEEDRACLEDPALWEVASRLDYTPQVVGFQSNGTPDDVATRASARPRRGPVQTAYGRIAGALRRAIEIKK